MLPLYALTLFVSASLLFMVQPLIGKLILPLLGGAPAVWTTCMVFFQAMLMAGYAYAHFSTARFGERKQSKLHLPLMLLPFLVLPLGVYTGLVPAGAKNPVFGLLLLLTASVGLPFFVISTTAPLLQKWFANTSHPAARDPYFLYAASNVGSMLALLSYPVLVEPFLPLAWQRWAWTAGYALLVVLTGVCAYLLWKSSPPVPVKPFKEQAPGKALPGTAPEAITLRVRLSRFAAEFVGPSLASRSLAKDADRVGWGKAAKWVALAFVPSSLMLGATTYITTDIAAIPLLWVLPLALYLLSFILVFSKLPELVHKVMVLALPVLMLLLVFLMVSKMRAQMWTLILLHLVVLFAVAMVCHGELARTRPTTRYLTQFYLWMSFGGVLGGLFNALVAPLIFTTPAEYPLAMVLAAMLLPRLDEPGDVKNHTRLLDLVLPMAMMVYCVEAFRGYPLMHKHLPSVADSVARGVDTVADALSMRPDHLRLILTFAPPVVLCYVFVERPLRFGFGVAVIFLSAALPNLTDREVLCRARSFFGALTIKCDEPPEDWSLRARLGLGDPGDAEGPAEGYTRLMHGNILHGMQNRDPAHRREPLTYYHETGPVGQLFAAFTGENAKKEVAVIGLGTGTMACYVDPGQRLTFYEIDPLVKSVSFDRKKYFSYVLDAKERGAEVDIVLGDARLSLDRERATKPDQKYDVIAVDAFSSDAIPVHLMTREALGIYLDKLKDDGIIAFHTSNRYLELEPVVANIAAERGLVAVEMYDRDDSAPGKSVSTWVLVARDKAHFGKLWDEVGDESGKRWKELKADPQYRVWSDDYSNLLSVFQWKSY
jgi:hypothetical protein